MWMFLLKDGGELQIHPNQNTTLIQKTTTTIQIQIPQRHLYPTLAS